MQSVTSQTIPFKLIQADALLLCFQSSCLVIILLASTLGSFLDSLINCCWGCPYFPAFWTCPPNLGLSETYKSLRSFLQSFFWEAIVGQLFYFLFFNSRNGLQQFYLTFDQTQPLYMASTKKEWVDYCTSIKEGDDNYNSMQKIVGSTGCSAINTQLTKCLQVHRKDWRKCKDESMKLAQCLKSNKAQN